MNELIPNELKEYVCPVHGDIRKEVLLSNLKGNEAVLCLRCWIEKLKELGVCEVEEKNDENADPR